MSNQFARTELLIEKDGLNKLQESKVAIFGIGGVGSFVAEGLARAGIGSFVLVDNDKICESNINRQIHALHDTIGEFKVDVMKERILKINSDVKVEVFKEFYTQDSKVNILDNSISYIVDAIDSIDSKVDLIQEAQKKEIPIISSMGTGNKLDPTKFEVADIYETTVCPLAKVMRKRLKEKGITNLKVVYSKEKPIKVQKKLQENLSVGSISFVPSVAGLIIASEVVKDILKK